MVKKEMPSIIIIYQYSFVQVKERIGKWQREKEKKGSDNQYEIVCLNLFLHCS